jgi:hypothetical protein
MPNINDVFKRKAGDGPKVIRLVGVHGTSWVAASANEHAPPFEISPVDLSRDYGANFAEVDVVDEVSAWNALDSDWLDQARLEIERTTTAAAPSPEEVFKAQDEKT